MYILYNEYSVNESSFKIFNFFPFVLVVRAAALWSLCLIQGPLQTTISRNLMLTQKYVKINRKTLCSSLTSEALLHQDFSNVIYSKATQFACGFNDSTGPHSGCHTSTKVSIRFHRLWRPGVERCLDKVERTDGRHPCKEFPFMDPFNLFLTDHNCYLSWAEWIF